MIFKGSLWADLPSVLQKLNESLQVVVVSKLKGIFAENGYMDVASSWICSNITTMDQHTLEFVDYVNQLASQETTCNDVGFE